MNQNNLGSKFTLMHQTLNLDCVFYLYMYCYMIESTSGVILTLAVYRFNENL